MILPFPRPAGSPRSIALRLVPLFCAITAFLLPLDAPAQTITVPASISLAEYRSKLDALDRLVAACQRAMVPVNCQGSQVGPDLSVALSSGSREIRLGWLRDLLDRAGKPQPQNQAARKPPARLEPARAPNQPQDFSPPTLAVQLEDARLRLAADRGFAAQLSGNSAVYPAPEYPSQRQALAGILAGKQYHAAAARPTIFQQIMEKIGNWLDIAISRLMQAGVRSRWFGVAAEAGFGLLVAGALVWFLIRLERQGRLNSILLHPGLAAGAASARDWQLWLEDARSAAAQGAWRDAIHLLYWASISRLESSGLWPADRARTPREYLALLSQASVQRPGLATLTRSFERTWYAGRPAQEADFREAEQLAAQLGVSSGTSRSSLGAQ